MATIARLEPFRGLSALQDQFNRIFNESFRNQGEESALTTWAPAVDIYETPNELVVKADLPDVNEKDIDVRVENNLLTIRGERKFEKSVSEENYLRVERTYGAFSRSFSLAEHGEPGSDRRRIQERRADRDLAEARGVQAAPGEGERHHARATGSKRPRAAGRLVATQQGPVRRPAPCFPNREVKHSWSASTNSL